MSKRCGFLDAAAMLLRLAPLRCRKCRLRFYRPWFLANRLAPAVTVPSPVSAEAPDVRRLTPTAAGPRPIVLLLDEDPALRRLFRRLLDKRGYEVREAADTNAAIAQVRDLGAALVIVNVNDSKDAAAAAKLLRHANPKVIVIALSETRTLAEDSERLLILPRPSSVSTVIEAVRDLPPPYRPWRELWSS